MKTRVLASIILTAALTLAARAQVPGIINYQGRVTVGGTNFNGTGTFKFALVNSDGTTNYWSNDGTAVGQPATAVSLTVTKGLYSVLLGDTTIANMTLAVAPTMFTNADVRLRAWFNDGISGFQQLNPDQRLAAVGYALMAAGVNSGGDIVGNRLNIGLGHSLSGILASIAGGSNNAAYSAYSIIGGGFGNTIGIFLAGYSGSENVLGGGLSNSITTFSSDNFLGGGSGNGIGSFASDNVLGGGSGNSIAGDSSPGDQSAYNVLVGGFGNHVIFGGYNFIGGGSGNQIYYVVNGGPPFDDVIVGGYSNRVIEANYAVIGGGRSNQISGGAFNSPDYSTIGGGLGNNISGTGAAAGIGSTIPGGVGNTVVGDYCFAAGHQALATNSGAFVWADNSTNAPFASTVTNQFSARAAGGVRFFTNRGTSLGAQLAPNATSWTALSDRNAKENIEPISVRDVLNGLVSMPISRWSYKDDPTQRRYIGPMAQDFHSAFGLGDDDKRINTLDTDGVTLAAIQGLNQKVEQQRSELQAKQSEIDDLKRHLAELETKVQRVSEQVEQSRGAAIPAANVHERGGM